MPSGCQNVKDSIYPAPGTWTKCWGLQTDTYNSNTAATVWNPGTRAESPRSHRCHQPCVTVTVRVLVLQRNWAAQSPQTPKGEKLKLPCDFWCAVGLGLSAVNLSTDLQSPFMACIVRWSSYRTLLFNAGLSQRRGLKNGQDAVLSRCYKMI